MNGRRDFIRQLLSLIPTLFLFSKCEPLVWTHDCGRPVDADGVHLEWATKCNVHTGVYERFKRENGEFVVKNGRIVREIVKARPPIKVYQDEVDSSTITL